MPTIQFKAKPEAIYNSDDTLAYKRIKIPKLTASHCDMSAFRASKRFQAYANSDLFEAILKRAVEALGIKGYLRLDLPFPPAVSVNASSFLAVVTIELSEV